ncbi:MAG: septal ring lytic transglycosylase RlpA family protein [Lentisphaeria bacterium]
MQKPRLSPGVVIAVLALLVLVVKTCFPEFGEVETGLASYYSSSLEGRETASGEVYRESRLTAAHRDIPLGSEVRVTNLDNGKSVVVQINDRGPYDDDRIIDLSKAAAKKLDFLKEGTAKVKIEMAAD